MEPAAVPPRTHVLRPHHVGLIAVFLYAFNPSLARASALSSGFMLHIYRVLAREISETRPPTPYLEMISLATSFNSQVPQEVKALRTTLQVQPQKLSSLDALNNFFNDVYHLVADRDDTAPRSPAALIERRSYFGLFIRRCRISYLKLSFAGAAKLQNDFVSWAKGDLNAGYELKEVDRGDGLLLFPGIGDENQYAQTAAYERYLEAAANGDTQSAIENLRRFFDQHFSEKDESGVHQHALLNLATLHYSLGEFAAAKQALEEAIKVARAGSDKDTLQQCMSLLRRIEPSQGTTLLDRSKSIQSGTSPLDILWDIKRIIDLGEPLRTAFTKVYESMGCQDAADEYPITNKWARHAAQAAIWRMAGVESLAQTHEGIILTFTEASDDESRLTALCSKARTLVGRGKCSDALAVLLDPQTWKGLNSRQYAFWALEVWEALARTAERRDQTVVLNEFLVPRRPPSREQTQAYSWDPKSDTKTSSTASLHLAQKLRDAKQIATAVNPLMDALWNAEFRGYYGLYRSAVVMLADIGIELGMPVASQRMIEECLPQLLNGDDLEQRAFACFILARCIIAAASVSAKPDDADANWTPMPDHLQPALRAAIPFINTAISDYKTLERFQQCLDALYLLAVVYHNLDMIPERNRTAEQHRKVEKERKEIVGLEVDDGLKEILDLVAGVGKMFGPQ